MNIFIVSTFGDSIELAEKLKQENHDTSLYVRDSHIKLPSSIVTITKNPYLEMKNADLCIIEDVSSKELVERAKKIGKITLGGGPIIDRLLKDEKFGTEVLLGCGFQLAKNETKGRLIEVGSWFVNGGFLKPYFLAFKYMRFGFEDVGPEIGPMGIVGTYKLKGKIFRDTLLKLEPFLKSIGYSGYFGLDLLINNDKFHVVGWQPGLYFPTGNLLSKMHNNFGNFLLKVANGEAKITAVQPDKVGIGITWLDLSWLYENPIKHRPRIVCESGVNIDEARSRISKKLNKELETSLYYRKDIGSTSKDELKKLMSCGWV